VPHSAPFLHGARRSLGLPTTTLHSWFCEASLSMSDLRVVSDKPVAEVGGGSCWQSRWQYQAMVQYKAVGGARGELAGSRLVCAKCLPFPLSKIEKFPATRTNPPGVARGVPLRCVCYFGF
jgi:hypothetical protein